MLRDRLSTASISPPSVIASSVIPRWVRRASTGLLWQRWVSIHRAVGRVGPQYHVERDQGHRRLDRRADQARYHPGVGKDGTRLKPPMGFPCYARMNDADLSASSLICARSLRRTNRLCHSPRLRGVGKIHHPISITKPRDSAFASPQRARARRSCATISDRGGDNHPPRQDRVESETLKMAANDSVVRRTLALAGVEFIDEDGGGRVYDCAFVSGE